MEENLVRVVVEQADKINIPGYMLTILGAVLPGVLVFVISELLKKNLPTSSLDYKRLRSKISQSLTLYACYYHNPVDISDFNNELPDNYKAAAEALRALACELRAFIETLPWYKFPFKEALYTVSAELIGLSNNLCVPYNTHDDRRIEQIMERERNIRRLLKIYKYAQQNQN